MTDELRKRIWELIEEFRELNQTAFFMILEPVVTGENLVMPEFVSTESPEGVARLICMLADGLRNTGMPPAIIRVERPK